MNRLEESAEILPRQPWSSSITSPRISVTGQHGAQLLKLQCHASRYLSGALVSGDCASHHHHVDACVYKAVDAVEGHSARDRALHFTAALSMFNWSIAERLALGSRRARANTEWEPPSTKGRGPFDGVGCADQVNHDFSTVHGSSFESVLDGALVGYRQNSDNISPPAKSAGRLDFAGVDYFEVGKVGQGRVLRLQDFQGCTRAR